MRFFSDIKGFTLIELMVTLALLGLVIAGGFSLYFFADRSFVSGSIMADIQADVQLAMRRATEEVRLAHSLQLIDLDDIPDSIDSENDDDHYLFAKDGSIFLRTVDRDRLILQGNAASTSYNMYFEPVHVDDAKVENMLAITISSQNPQVDYKLESELEILNLRWGEIEGDSRSEAIKFTKTFTPEEFDKVEKYVPGCLFRRHVYSSGAPELDKLRQFRDNSLAKNPLGRLISRAYYSASPVVSDFLDDHPLARATTKTILRGVSQVIIKLT